MEYSGNIKKQSSASFLETTRVANNAESLTRISAEQDVVIGYFILLNLSYVTLRPFTEIGFINPLYLFIDVA